MLTRDVLSLLRCPACQCESLAHSAFATASSGGILQGVVWCEGCRTWFPVEDGILDLLTGKLVYRADRDQFWTRHRHLLTPLGLAEDSPASVADQGPQTHQQRHFDWYAANERQTYLEYEQMNFWRAVDALAFSTWRGQVDAGGWLLDVGCGPGRSTAWMMDLDLRIVGFDVSKAAVRQARERSRARPFKARATFLIADATPLPFCSQSLDYVLVYGVLHHVPDPQALCREVARVLRVGGRYFGCENNQTVFRLLFDAWQRLIPLWHEEAGEEPLISARMLGDWFRGTGIALGTDTRVFLPPHLINQLPLGAARSLLGLSDRIASAVPILRQNGGLIFAEGLKGA